jgi:aminomethyltransferase
VEKKTPLYEEHVKAHARIVPFAGFLMPIQYSGIIEEHRAVRNNMGMFDLSHMGEFRITGRQAVEAVDYLVTNDIRGLEEQQVRYTPMCYPDGGIVDDLLVYRFPDHLMAVVNAANIEKDLVWMQEHLRGEVEIENVSDQTALLAVQGPRAAELLEGLTDADLAALRYYHFTSGTVAGVKANLSRTGYTGEDGFELYVGAEDAERLWEALVQCGRPEGLKLVGLGARDTLRLEAGYMLYGNDIDETTSPLEAGLGWTVKFGEADFVGRAALERQKAEGVARRMVGLEMLDRSIPRPHFAVSMDGQPIGELTSGTFSPTFNKGIGLGYIRADVSKAGTDVTVQIRDQWHPARLVRKPMYKREGA